MERKDISMKKGIFVANSLIAMITFICMGATSSIADDVVSEAELKRDYEYSTNDETVTIWAWHGDDEEVEIPGEIDGKKVTAIGDCAFEDSYSLKEVIIPDSVTSIGYRAFAGCPKLERIVIPASVSNIKDTPFCDCYSLNEIAVSQENKSFSSVDGVLINEDEKALVCCPAGLDVSVCTIPDGIYSIKEKAFSDCNNLESIEIPESVTSIGESAFDACGNLKSITIPGSLSEIGVLAFLGCNSLESFEISSENEYYKTEDNALVQIKDNTLICYPNGSGNHNYTIPDGVTSIGECAFVLCDSLEKIEMPDSVTAIEEYAFSDCCNLEEIKLSSSLKTIGDAAFANCGKLKTVDIPDSVTEIGNGTFSICYNLTSVTVPDSVKKMGAHVFICDPELTLSVGRDSYAAGYAEENGIPYTVDW